MITFDIHDVRNISARANASECGRFGWVKLTMGGPKELVEITAYMPIAQATSYANAINLARDNPNAIVPLTPAAEAA